MSNKQLLIYDNVEPLSTEKHRQWALSVSDYNFVSELNSVPLLASEIPFAAAEYPVIFSATKTEGEYLPLAVMGLREKQNLLLNDKGQLTTRYIPAFIRRYPFVFANSSEGNLALCIDEGTKFWDKEGKKGQRLFDDEGGQTDYLKQVLKFLQDYQQRTEMTRVFCKRLHELNLLEPVEANIKFKEHEDQNFNVSGFLMVKREKLKALKDEDVQDLFNKDALELLYAHMHSMDHFNGLINKMAAKLKAEKQAANA